MMESRGIHTWVTRGYGLKSNHCLGMFKGAQVENYGGVVIRVHFQVRRGGVLVWFHKIVVTDAVMVGQQHRQNQN
jgi:hypothetical protein